MRMTEWKSNKNGSQKNERRLWTEVTGIRPREFLLSFYLLVSVGTVIFLLGAGLFWMSL